MSLKNWFLLLFGLANHKLQLRAEDVNKTCAGNGNWTVFQRRKYGDVDFFRGWDDYVKGFGNCDGDFWLGLEELHQLTKGGNMSLEINMMSRSIKNHWVAKYSHFRIGSAYDNYTLHVSGFSGNAPYDSFSRHNNSQFSTKDADHDGSSRFNYAYDHKGGWWYGDCIHDVYLPMDDGYYHKFDVCARSDLNRNFNDRFGIYWWDGVHRGLYDPPDLVIFLCCSEMKIYKRP